MNTQQADPRNLNVYSASEFEHLSRKAQRRKERARLEALTPAQKMNEVLQSVAQRYAPDGEFWSNPKTDGVKA